MGAFAQPAVRLDRRRLQPRLPSRPMSQVRGLEEVRVTVRIDASLGERPCPSEMGPATPASMSPSGRVRDPFHRFLAVAIACTRPVELDLRAANSASRFNAAPSPLAKLLRATLTVIDWAAPPRPYPRNERGRLRPDRRDDPREDWLLWESGRHIRDLDAREPPLNALLARGRDERDRERSAGSARRLRSGDRAGHGL